MIQISPDDEALFSLLKSAPKEKREMKRKGSEKM